MLLMLALLARLLALLASRLGPRLAALSPLCAAGERWRVRPWWLLLAAGLLLVVAATAACSRQERTGMAWRGGREARKVWCMPCVR